MRWEEGGYKCYLRKSHVFTPVYLVGSCSISDAGIRQSFGFHLLEPPELRLSLVIESQPKDNPYMYLPILQ